ncbi:MAG: flagellar protein FliT [Rhodanobacter sp.]
MSGTLARALHLSRQMLTAAQAREWATLSALDAERDPLLLAAHAPDATTRNQLAQILACNRELESHVTRAREVVAVQWQQEHARGQAILAYGQR